MAESSSTGAIPGMQADGWFREESTMWPGQAMALRAGAVLFDAQTAFQRLTVFDNTPHGPWGRVMTLDGAIQLTQKDEFCYHEMMAHLPLLAHAAPESVLIVGGGDGGVLREVLKHKSVKRAALVDIDGGVIEQAKAFFPDVVGGSFDDPRAEITVGDGAAFVKHKVAEYDVIIVDSSDPEGPASALFGAEFYAAVKLALKPGGIVCCQGESVWLHLELIQRMATFLRDGAGFPLVRYGLIAVPTYPCGSIGALIASRDGSNVAVPARSLTEALGADAAAALKYYDEAVHRAAFVLPRFAQSLNQ